MRVRELILYRQFGSSSALSDVVFLAEQAFNTTDEQKEEVIYRCIGKMVEQAEAYGFEGNLWHNYLTFLLVNHENAYSLSSEVCGAVEGSINQAALHDFSIFMELFADNLRVLKQNVGHMTELLEDYHCTGSGKKLLSRRIRDAICMLSRKLGQASSVKEFQLLVTGFYQQFGTGKLGLHKAFRVERREEQVRIVPIENTAKVHLDDLIGYDIPKQKLIRNTEAFISGRKANNCLLFGDAGTGKSTSIKAILNQFYDRGLRMIELYKHQFRDLNSVISQIKNRNYKFIIYMDDLSFEEFEVEYKYLKAVIEGGLEKKPDNVLIYATSNRRHLVREQFSDKEGRREDLHASDTVQEKLSLVARFGVSIFFVGPDRKEFQDIVLTLARRNGIVMAEEELLAEANKWELFHNGRSGRTAQQFIDHLLGEEKKTE